MHHRTETTTKRDDCIARADREEGGSRRGMGFDFSLNGSIINAYILTCLQCSAPLVR